jgi:hypothetical protein
LVTSSVVISVQGSKVPAPVDPDGAFPGAIVEVACSAGRLACGTGEAAGVAGLQPAKQKQVTRVRTRIRRTGCGKLNFLHIYDLLDELYQ